MDSDFTPQAMEEDSGKHVLHVDHAYENSQQGVSTILPQHLPIRYLFTISRLKQLQGALPKYHPTSLSCQPSHLPPIFSLSLSNSQNLHRSVLTRAMASSSQNLSVPTDRPSSPPLLDCYVCLRMAKRKPERRQEGPSQIWLLCDNRFCITHKGKEEGVCEINHETYYSKQRHHDIHEVDIYPSLEERNRRMAEAWSRYNSGKS